MNKTLILSIAVIICVAILGGIYYSVEMNKQKATKRQQAINAEQLQDCIRQAEKQHKDNEATALNYSNNDCRKEFTQDACIKGFIEALDEYEAEEKQAIETCYTRFNK